MERNIDKATARFKTRLAVTLSGDLGDFNDTNTRQLMTMGFAGTIGVSTEQVDLLLVQGSVQATFITYSSTEASQQAAVASDE